MSRFLLFLRKFGLSCSCLIITFGAAFPQNLQVPDTLELSVLRVSTDSFPVVTTYFRVEKVGGGNMPVFKTEDLCILEDGEICSFLSLKRVSEATPIHLALVMDRSSSMMDEFVYRFDTIRGVLFLQPGAIRKKDEPYAFDRAKEAVLTLAHKLFLPRDGYLFVSFSDRVDPMKGMSRDTAGALAQLNALRATGSTAFFDGIMAALDSLPAYPGLRAVVALTDGIDNASKATESEVIARANLTQSPLYLVGLGNVDREAMIRMAAQTRGACYFLERGEDLKPVYEDIYNRVRSVYVASYKSPQEPKSDHEYHVEVRVHGDEVCMKGHGLRYRVPVELAERYAWIGNLKRGLIGMGLLLLAVGIAWWAFGRKKTPDVSTWQPLPDLPELLPPPRAFPNPTQGPLTVRLDVSGSTPTALLFVQNEEGMVVRRFEVSGYQPWVDLDLSSLSHGKYALRCSYQDSISAPTWVALGRAED